MVAVFRRVRKMWAEPRCVAVNKLKFGIKFNFARLALTSTTRW